MALVAGRRHERYHHLKGLAVRFSHADLSGSVKGCSAGPLRSGQRRWLHEAALVYSYHHAVNHTYYFLVMQLVNAFQEFNGPYLVTGKGPLNATYLTSMYIYDNAFKYFNMGYASAASWILFLIIVAVTLILFATQDKWVYYSDGGN